MLYLYLKAFHIIVVISWFAGVFYLPRLFVYHAMVGPEETAAHERYCTQERKLYKFVTPFMVLTLVFGVWMIWIQGLSYLKTNHWLHAKIALVVVLFGYHGYLGRLVRTFREGKNVRSHKFYRVVNELPVLLLFAIVILVVVKPF